MVVEEVRHESLSSVEFKTSAKGEISWTVKVYNEDPDVAYKKALELAGKAHYDSQPHVIAQLIRTLEKDVKA